MSLKKMLKKHICYIFYKKICIDKKKLIKLLSVLLSYLFKIKKIIININYFLPLVFDSKNIKILSK